MKDYLERIKANCSSSVISILADGIVQTSDMTDLHTMRRMSWLSLWLFVFGKKGDALYFANIVSQLDLTLYNKSVKGFVDSPAIAHSFKYNALVLCTVICREMNDNEKADEYWNQSLIIRFETNKFGEQSNGNVARKRWKRNLEKGDLVDLYNDKRLSYISNGKKAFYESSHLLREFLWMQQAGGSELYPPTKLTNMIDDIMNYLRENIDDVDKDYLKFHIK